MVHKLHACSKDNPLCVLSIKLAYYNDFIETAYKTVFQNQVKAINFCECKFS